jgi:hypothetical protein
MEAFNRGITPPAAATLRTYGLTADEWLGLLKAQDWKCPICLQGNDRPKTGKKALWNTDHEHVPKWAKMPPEERKRYVRGILCYYCNHRRVNSRMASPEAQRIADYIRAYEERRGS